MRRRFVFTLLVLMFGGLVAAHVLSPAPPAPDPAPEPLPPPEESAPEESKSTEAIESDVPAEAPLPDKMDRPLRVAGLRWEVLAPGLVAANDGDENAFAKEGVPVELRHVSSRRKLEEALARGGESKNGADVALLSLPEFVASYQRLRALEPQVFFVIATSHGREALAATSAVDFTKRRPFGKTKTVNVVAEPRTPEAFLALFVLDTVGVSPESVRLVSAADASGNLAPLAARTRGATDDTRRTVVTTADATGLIPIVAVAPHGLLAEHGDALAGWASAWLRGARLLTADVPAAARRIAKLKGAPSELELLETLGGIRLCYLRENAQLAGLSGRGAATLDELFVRTWKIWRAAGVLSVPSPEAAPLNNEVITTLVRDASAADLAARHEPDRKDSGEALLVFRMPKSRLSELDDQALIDEIGFLAGVFGRSSLELAIRNSPRRTGSVVRRATERYGLGPERLVAGEVDLDRHPAAVGVLGAN